MQIEYCSKCSVRLDGKDLVEARSYRTRELLCEECRNAATVKPNRIIPSANPRSSSPRRSTTNYAVRAARAPRRQTSPGSLTLLIAVLLAAATGIVVLAILRIEPTTALPEKQDPQPNDTTKDRELAASEAYLELILFKGIKENDRAARVKCVQDFIGQYDGTSTAVKARVLLNKLKTSAPEARYRINCGGNAQGTFIADAFYTEGETYFGNAKIDVSKASTPAPEAVYQSDRFGNFDYVLPNLEPGKEYLVRLHFAELVADKAEKRLFNVRSNDTDILEKLDIFAVAKGKNRAVVRDVSVKADDQGCVRLEFRGAKDNARCSAIEILEIPPTPSTESASTNKGPPAEVVPIPTQEPDQPKKEDVAPAPSQKPSQPESSPPGPAPKGINLRVVSFTLIDALSDRVIADHDPLVEGTVLSYQKLGTTEINLRANVEGRVKCVVFDVDGKLKFKVEDQEPYAMAGDRDADYDGWETRPGAHSVTATPYTKKEAKGTPGQPLTLNFTIRP